MNSSASIYYPFDNRVPEFGVFSAPSAGEFIRDFASLGSRKNLLEPAGFSLAGGNQKSREIRKSGNPTHIKHKKKAVKTLYFVFKKRNANAICNMFPL